MSAKYTGSQGQSTIMCKNYKSPLKHELKKKKKDQNSNTTTQSKRVLKKKSLRSGTFFSESSKLLLFLSHQMHHIQQCGTAIQIAPFPCHTSFPCQQAKSSTTIFSIT